MNIRNVARVLALIVFFVSFSWVVGHSHQRDFAKTRAILEMGAADGPVLVDHSICRYLLPMGEFELLLNRVLCSGCVAQAEELRTHYEIEVVGDGHCASRGTNAILFKKK